MLRKLLKLPLHFLSLFPYPLHLVIEGSTGSGKTWLAQYLAKNFASYIEIWKSFYFSEISSIIPDAPVYQPTHYSASDELPLIWQERISFWLDNASNESRCILIDEVPCILKLEDLVLKFLRSAEDTNIIVTTQDFKAEKGLEEHSLKKQFALIRLGENAKRHAKYVLQNTKLLQQLEAAKYPCLFQSKAIDLAEFKVDN